MATITAPVFCALPDLYDVLSQPGVTLRTDDGPPTNLGNAIDRGCNKVWLMLNRHYATDQLLMSSQVTQWAAVCCCKYLSTRRGNPVAPGVQIMYAEVIADMTEIQKGRNEIPGISRRKSFVPTISIKSVSQRLGMNRGVIEVSRGSTVTRAENIQQEQDLWDRLGFNSILKVVG